MRPAGPGQLPGADSAEVPELKVSFCAAPANKFLARLMGKSSSLNNLANLADECAPGVRLSAVPRHLSITPEFGAQLSKVKSLSTSEICRPLSPSSQTPPQQPQRYGSGLLDASDVPIGSCQRPASYHGSLESLGLYETGAAPGLDRSVDAEPQPQPLFRCPWSTSCLLELPRPRLVAHGRSHGGPLLLAFRTHCVLPLPLGGPLCIATGPRDFFVDTCQRADGGSCVRAWMAASPSECAFWKVNVAFHHDSGTSRCDISVRSLSAKEPDSREDGAGACACIPSHSRALELDIAGTDSPAKCSSTITSSLESGVSAKDKWR